MLQIDTKHDQSMMKRHHTLLVFRLIKRFGSLSRAELAKLTQMSATSVSRIVKELIENQYIIEVGESKGNVGRRAIMLEVNPSGRLIMGVNIETDFLEIGLVDLNGKVQHLTKEKIDKSTSPEVLLEKISQKINGMKEEHEGLMSKIMGCGISIPGIVDYRKGKILQVPQLDWKNVEVQQFLEKRINLKVCVENQVKAILLSESLYGNAVGIENAACIYVGSGLGAAYMEGGELIRGVNNMAGEIGHTTINPTGVLCDCGRIGCLQTYICSSALEKESGKPIQEIFSAKENNEAWATQLIERAAEYFALTISNVVNTYNPEVIILAGKMVEDFPEWVEMTKEKVMNYLWKIVDESDELKFHSIGEVGVLGASCIVLKEFLESPIEK